MDPQFYSTCWDPYEPHRIPEKVNFSKLEETGKGQESVLDGKLYADLEYAIKNAGLSEEAIKKMTPLEAQEILMKTKVGSKYQKVWDDKLDKIAKSASKNQK